MGCYNMYVFTRRGKCLFYREWNRPNNPLAHDPAEDRRLVFGLIFSMQQMCLQLSPRGSAPGQEGLQSFRTPNYALHYFESPSGVIFALTADPSTPVLRTALWHIYANIFVPHVVRNPLCQVGQPITAAKFQSQLDQFVATL